jgi:hypothetical protein
VASGTGAEAPVASRWSRRRPHARARVWAARRDGRSLGAGCAWATVEKPCGGGGGGVSAAAADLLWWRRLGIGRERDREARGRMKRCGLGPLLKFLIFDDALGGRRR